MGFKFNRREPRIERYPVSAEWRIPAKLIPNTNHKTLTVPDVLGNINEEEIPGELAFQYKGKEYRVTPTGNAESKRYFLVFGDQTNGEETYGAGRFVYFDAADENGNTVIDFNKAYNPPCVFTPYATCPLPADENILPFKVTAGEKNFGHHH